MLITGVQMFEFKDFDYLTDGGIDLKIEDKTPQLKMIL